MVGPTPDLQRIEHGESRSSRDKGPRELPSSPGGLTAVVGVGLLLATGFLALGILGLLGVTQGSLVGVAGSFLIAIVGFSLVTPLAALARTSRRAAEFAESSRPPLALAVGREAGQRFPLDARVVIATDQEVIVLRARLVGSPEVVSRSPYSEITDYRSMMGGDLEIAASDGVHRFKGVPPSNAASLLDVIRAKTQRPPQPRPR